MGLFRGHTTTTRANKISEFTVATAEYGAAVPEIIGTTRVSGNVIYYDDFTAHEHRETQRTGKGGHSKSVSITYTYTVAVILGLCEGEISGLGRVWIGKDQYMYPNDAIQMTLFKGQANQQPWAYVSGKHPDKALPYTGLAYMAGVIDLGDSGSMPNYNFEVKGKLLSSGDGVDANPADYIRYVLDKVGLSKTEIIGLDNYRSYCKHADLLISTPMDQTSAKTARDIINEIATLTNAYMFWSNDKFKIVCCDDRSYPSRNPEDPNDNGWQPNRTIIYDLTADDFIPQTGGALVTYSRKDSSEIYNQFPVEFVNRDSGYEKETISYALTQDIADYGLRQANTTSASYIYTKARAVKVAETLARKAQYERNKYTFKLDWAFCRLEVGDLVTLTDESCGLNKQPAMIDSVTEGTDGLLTITAISRAKGDYSAASFDVHAVDRPYVDYNVAPPDTDAPIILQPPAELTTSGLEVWIGARGKSDGWGGCRVYVSDNKDYYRYAGQIATAARIGTLASAVSADATSIEIDANGDFLSGTQQDAERGNTLCWLGGECLSYQTATLLQTGHYELMGCIRGQYQTTATKHDAGAEFARLDTALLRIPFLKEDIGKKVYLKLASYNIFGNNEQDLSNLDEYEYTILPYYIPPVRNLKAHNRYRQLVDGVSRYDLEVEWEPPEDMTSYLEGQVWYKTDHEQGDRLVIKEGVPADELGYQHDWTFAGSGQNRATIPQAIVGDTYRIAVTTKDRWGAMTSPDQAPRIEILVAVKSEIPNTPENFGITFGNKAELYWDEVTNSDIAYYEVRTDQSAGLGTASLVVRTSSLKASVTLAERTGTLYLYACNAQGKYSYPAVLTYKKTRPDAPTNIAITTALRGANFRVPPIPSTATSVRYYISGTKTTDMIESKNPLVVYQCEPDVYSIYACYVDIFGEGYRTVDYAFTVTPYIDPEWLKDEAISLKKVDKEIQNAVKDAQQALPNLNEKVAELTKTDDEIKATVQDNTTKMSSQIKQNADSITSVVTNLSDSDKAKKNYSAIAQLNDDIALRVAKDDVINQINISKESILIDGNKTHITGDTKIDKNVIVGGMIAAGSITADKLSASTLALSNNQGIQGGNVILDSNGMTCTDSKGTTIQFGQDGMTSKDKNGNSFAILSQCMMGVAKNGQYVKFANPWTEIPVVIITPQNVQTNNPDYSTSKVRLHCYAEDISVNGFRVRAYSGIAEGAGSFSQYQECGSMSWTIWRSGSDRNVTLPYGSRSITFTVKMPSNASRVAFHGRFGMNLGYKYSNFVRFPNSESQNISIKCNGKETYNGMFFSNDNNNEIHGPSGVDGTDEYCSYVSKIFTVAQGSDLTCTLTLSPWTEHDGDGSDGLRVWLIIDSLDVYVDGEQILDNDGTGAFFVVNRSNGLYTLQ